jgi:hypothetical protein
MDAIKRFAYFLRLTDDDGLLSITHLAVYVGIVALALGRQIAWSDFAAFAVALGSYRIKRAVETPAADSETVAQLGTAVTALEAKMKTVATPDRLAQAAAFFDKQKQK